MSTLSSSLSALSSSTVTDVWARFRRTPLTDAEGLRVGRWATIAWGIAFILPATVFESDSGNIVILALGIAGITYGGLLGAFVFGMVNKRATAVDANIAFVLAIAVNAYFFIMEKYVTGEIWVAWQWYPLLGVIVMVVVGGDALPAPPVSPARTPAEVGRKPPSMTDQSQPAPSADARPRLSPTEQRNSRSAGLDDLDALGVLRLLNTEDRVVIDAVATALPRLAALVDTAAERMRAGGTVHYFGAGTSGRLGVLDASELMPTFNLEPGRVVGHIAGGEPALVNAVENAEDS